MPSQETLHIDGYVHHVVNDPLLEGKPLYQQCSVTMEKVFSTIRGPHKQWSDQL